VANWINSHFSSPNSITSNGSFHLSVSAVRATFFSIFTTGTVIITVMAFVAAV
jgi:hypothetical protein